MDDDSTMGARPHAEARKRDEAWCLEVASSGRFGHSCLVSTKQGGSMKKLMISVALAVAALALPALSMAQSRRVVVVHHPVHHRPVHHHYHHRAYHHRPYHRPPPRHHPAYHPAYHR